MFLHFLQNYKKFLDQKDSRRDRKGKGKTLRR